MAKKRLKIKDKQGNVVDYDISAASITIDAEGKSLDVKLSEIATALLQAVTEVTFNGIPYNRENGKINLGQQMQADWNENNTNWPAYIRNKPNSVVNEMLYDQQSRKVRQRRNGVVEDVFTLPEEGSQVTFDEQMSSTSENGVQNKVIKAYVDAVSQRIDTLLGSGNVQGAIDTFNEVVAFLNGISSSDTLAAKLLLKANTADVYSKTEVDDKVANAGKVKSVTINGTKNLPDGETGDVDLGEVQGGKDGITPHIDVVTGHWFIGDEDTGIPARGLQGNSGYTGSVGELEVVEDYTKGGVGKAASAEAVKDMAIKSIPDAGTFGDAYDKAKDNNVVFPWLLRDVDKDGNSVTKMIWHVGNREFVDAIGSKIDGVKNGLTITTVKPCYMKIWEQGPDNKADSASVTEIYQLVTGENNFGFEEVGSTFFFMNFFIDAEATTEVTDAVESVDFGGMVCTCAQSMPTYPTTPRYNLLKGQTALLSVRRLVYAVEDAGAENLRRGVIGLCSDCVNLESFSASGSIKLGDYQYSSGFSILANTPKLANLDIKDLEIEDAKSLGGFTKFQYLQTLDIRGLSFTGGTVEYFLRECTSVKTLIIGNLNEPESGFVQYYRTSLDRIVCTTQAPPTLQVHQEGDNKDWVRNYLNKSTGVILVPPGCGNTYKQASGWSVYADKISEYNEGDY